MTVYDGDSDYTLDGKPADVLYNQKYVYVGDNWVNGDGPFYAIAIKGAESQNLVKKIMSLPGHRIKSSWLEDQGFDDANMLFAFD